MPERNYSFEALAEVTDTDWNAGRGELNAALKSIREQEPQLTDDYLLSCEIHDRAKLYRQTMGEGVLLTPSALAKHWRRVLEQQPKPVTVNAPTAPSAYGCDTCHGDKLVLFSVRDPGFEMYVPCPQCNANADTTFWRPDGTRVTTPRGGVLT
jgi:hypothetical protein